MSICIANESGVANPLFLYLPQVIVAPQPNRRVLSLSKWCWCFALQICPWSSLDSKLNFSSCTYSHDFYTWTFLSLCVCDLFFLCHCWCSFILQEQRQRVRLSGSLLVVDEVRTRGFQNTQPQELSASPFQRYDGCIGWLILILQLLQTFVELARCERVMTTRAKFHFSLAYTFSATPRSLQISAPVPPRETGCDPALSAQLCWSSGSSFPHRLSDLMYIWLAVHLIRPVKGQRLDNLAVFLVSRHFAIAMVSFSSLTFLTFAK